MVTTIFYQDKHLMQTMQHIFEAAVEQASSRTVLKYYESLTKLFS